MPVLDGGPRGASGASSAKGIRASFLALALFFAAFFFAGSFAPAFAAFFAGAFFSSYALYSGCFPWNGRPHRGQ